MKKSYIIIFLLLLPLIFGCNQNNDPTNETKNIEQINNQATTHSEVTDYIFKHFDSVSDIRTVVYKQELIVAIKATTFQQINEQTIEKKVKKKLEKQFKFKKINVSSDQKIFIEINKLDHSTNNLKAKFNHIKKLLKDNV
ncbi:Sporulation lipoprotein YhcN/YlaJ (Spore_YhcN_YlaJ) [Paraliobacillus sp. PM-2]|uniref:YhcN/YlaJ family sporulation lipoprotein n=1 Tax=Paraliobacillus sp. PM-2 TaxID=1462524 RepID=UPI00061C89CE|nr:YhcN/YlaJ family sporulation lipoprotein [Paraliobacillus sp. PM-2]CQR47857.1 Sporulation lipoprotein YhcN/YlaJ (Spore_YhcN_YlaJ) [Paraliobacillus sp. PM-2]